MFVSCFIALLSKCALIINVRIDYNVPNNQQIKGYSPIYHFYSDRRQNENEHTICKFTRDWKESFVLTKEHIHRENRIYENGMH